MKATVTATSPFVGGSATSTTNTAGTIVLAKPYTAVLPTISGTKTVGLTLTASSSLASWSGSPSLSYQWRRCDTTGGTCTNIGGATASTYVLSSADQGNTIRVAVTGTNAGGSNTITSVNTASIAAAASSGGGGGGGGGGAGASTLTITVTPQSQTIASGGTASWTISFTNAGGAYLYSAGVSDPLAPNCGSIPSAYADIVYLLAPNVTVTYPCSRSGVTASFTNTVVASATTGPGPVVSATATAVVTVQGAATPTPAPPTGTTPRPPSPSPTPHVIEGTAKADHLTGTNKADVINGLGGNDVIHALGGNDTVNGGTGNDTIFGGAGNDKLTGGPGKDKIYGGAGADTIHVRDGARDVVDCGTGKDTVYADRSDAVAHNCEAVHRSKAGV
jgi:Ca2+-binding RTX toxin-like protein